MQDEKRPGAVRVQLAARICELMDLLGESRRSISDKWPISRKAVADAADPTKHLPTRASMQVVDKALEAGGELVELWKWARIEEEAADLKLEVDLVVELGDHADKERAARRGRAIPAGGDRQEPEGVDDTDRREFFEFGTAGLLAAETYRRRTARPDPDVLTLGELDDEVTAHAAALTTAPHEILAPRVFRTWRSAEALLEAGGRPKALTRLARTAGYASYTLCRLAFNLGDPTASRRFGTLAGEHAMQTDDTVLIASVAEMTSTLAFYAQRYEEAADVARSGGRQADHPYTRARLAANEARALAALGDIHGARVALSQMRASVVTAQARPGASPFGEAAADMFTGGVLARVGAGVEAEPLARAAVEAHNAGMGGGFEEYGHALLALAAELMARDKPVPDEAAAVAARVVGMLDERPTSSVTTKVYDVVTSLRPFEGLAPVRDLREQLASRPRLALIVGAA